MIRVFLGLRIEALMFNFFRGKERHKRWWTNIVKIVYSQIHLGIRIVPGCLKNILYHRKLSHSTEGLFN